MGGIPQLKFIMPMSILIAKINYFLKPQLCPSRKTALYTNLAQISVRCNPVTCHTWQSLCVMGPTWIESSTVRRVIAAALQDTEETWKRQKLALGPTAQAEALADDTGTCMHWQSVLCHTCLAVLQQTDSSNTLDTPHKAPPQTTADKEMEVKHPNYHT